MKILVVEDEPKIAGAVKRGLERQSFSVEVASDSDQALQDLKGQYDLVILDYMLPGSTDGLGILKQMRAGGNNTPVLFLTAKDRILDRAEGLNAGADDYLVKPFAFIELIARVRALLRRPTTKTDELTSYKDITIDPNTFMAKREGKNVSLTAREYALLEYFIRNAGKTLTKEQIIDNVWDYDADILPNTLEVYIGYLRNKLEKPFKAPKLIHTKRGFGYYFGEQ
jgi:DNA-binding response OmpR family regulator